MTDHTSRPAQWPSPERRSISRRSVVQAGAVAGGALAGRLWFPTATAAQDATPAAPPGLTVGVDYFPGTPEGAPAAYLKLPEPYESVPEVPGRGGTVSVFHILYQPPPPPREENRFWQEMEARLGVTWDIQLVPAADFDARFATTIAGGDLPDLMVVAGPASSRLGELVEQGAFTDLTDYLSGNALQEYPNLAAYPPSIWSNGSINGRIYSVPRPRPIAGTFMAFRTSWSERLGLEAPQNAAEFTEIMRAFTQDDPNGNGQTDTWGLGSHGGTPNFGRPFTDWMFRVPPGWRLEADGTLTADIETDEFRQAVSYMRDLFAAGLYHPEALSMTTPQAKDAIVSGSIGAMTDGIQASINLLTQAREIDPEAFVGGLVPPGHDGGAPTYHIGPGLFGGAFIPSSTGQDEERVRELLRILNYLAAPFGSEEYIVTNFGLEGVHHTVGPDGSLSLTEQGELERSDLFGVANPPVSFFYPQAPDHARYLHEHSIELLASGISNPTAALSSETQREVGGVLRQLEGDTVTAVVSGREPLDALDRFVEEWRSRGGDQVREEFEAALAEQ